MKTGLTLAALALCAILGAAYAEEEDAVAKEGEKAPEFTLKASDGKEYSLKDFAGKKAVVIAWYPRAFTGGCRLECLSFRDSGEEIQKFDVAYFTASVDDVETNTKWAKELELNYPVLCDPEKKVARAYGVVHKGRDVAERWTFIIDKEGVVRHIDKKVNTKTHGEDIVKMLEKLEIPKKQAKSKKEKA
jgi:peroxiredoxin Q/BCP